MKDPTISGLGPGRPAVEGSHRNPSGTSYFVTAGAQSGLVVGEQMRRNHSVRFTYKLDKLSNDLNNKGLDLTV